MVWVCWANFFQSRQFTNGNVHCVNWARGHFHTLILEIVKEIEKTELGILFHTFTKVSTLAILLSARVI